MRKAIWLLSILSAAAAAALPPAPPQFVSMRVNDGLPSSVVYKAVQDHDGFIWIGTQDGLARYDGVGFRIYRHDPADPASIASNDVSALLIDRDGRLWCGGEASGLNRLEADGQRFTHWRHQAGDLSSLASDDLSSIVQDSSGAIWVGTYDGGVNRLLQAGGGFAHVDHDEEDPATLRSSSVYTLLAQPDGRLWIGTDSGLDVREPDGRIVHVEIAPMQGRPGPPIVLGLIGDGDGVLAGTRKGVFRIGADLHLDREIAATTPPLAVTSFARGGDGDLWLGLLTGVARIDAAGRLDRYGTREGVAGAYPGTNTLDVMSDREGGIWFSLFDAGLARLPPHWRNFSVFRHVPGDAASLRHSRARAIAVDGDRAVWVGTGNDGIDRIDRASGVIERYGERLRIGNQRMTALLAVDADTLWVGFQRGLRRYSINNATSVEIPVDLKREDALPPGFVDRLLLDAQGRLWANAHGGGIVRIEGEPPRVTRRFLPATQTLGNADVRAIAFDAKGTPWLATQAGLERHDAARDAFYPVAGGPAQALDALAFAGDGTLWVHHWLGALESWHVEGTKVVRGQVIDASAGWPALKASALAVTDDGALWVTSLRGLWRVEPKSGAIRKYDTHEGLPSQEFLSGALSQASDGSLFAGTLGGALAFDPLQMRSDVPPPLLRLTALEVQRGGEVIALDPGKPLRLRHDDANLRIQVRALGYVDPLSTRYAFRLAGLEREAIQSDNGERIWSSLPPGNYTLEVSARSGNGAQVMLTPALALSVARAPWDTPLAYVVYAVGALLLMLLGWRATRERVRRQHAYALAEERRRSSEQISAAKSAFLANMGHEIRTPMTGVLGMSELLLTTPLDARQHGYAQAIRQSGELILRLINDSLDLARIEAGKLTFEEGAFDPVLLLREVAALEQPLAQRKGLALNLRLATDLPAMIGGDAMRVKQVLLNLVNNAIKFTEHGGVTLELLRVGADTLRYGVIDSGSGMNAQVCARLFKRFEQAAGVGLRHGGSGLGLAISHDLAVLMGGSLRVSSTPQVGSHFEFELPIRRAPAAEPVAPPPVPAAKGLSVLLIEDDATVAQVMAGLLDALGHRLRHVAHALAALAELEVAPVDLVLLDIDLPGIDGLQLARMIRSGAHAHLPLLAVTARSVGDEEVLVAAAGIDGLLRKPVTAKALAQAIEAALAGGRGAA